jgi:hypothetical protein
MGSTGKGPGTMSSDRETRPYERVIFVAASPAEVALLLREGADRVDVATAQREDGGLLLSSRWPRRRALVCVGIAPDSGGSRVDMMAMYSTRGGKPAYAGRVMDRVAEFLEAALSQGAERLRSRSQTIAARARWLRTSQTPLGVMGILLIIAGRLVTAPWGRGLEIAGVWVTFVAPMCLEFARIRVTGTGIRLDIAGLGSYCKRIERGCQRASRARQRFPASRRHSARVP